VAGSGLDAARYRHSPAWIGAEADGHCLRPRALPRPALELRPICRCGVRGV
jgi:hypothetical protein